MLLFNNPLCTKKFHIVFSLDPTTSVHSFLHNSLIPFSLWIAAHASDYNKLQILITLATTIGKELAFRKAWQVSKW